MTQEKRTGVVVAGVPAEVARYQEQQSSVDQMITKAIEQNLPVETMERVLAMRTQLKAEWAKERFDHAMAECQGEIPVIEKSKQARDETKGKDLYRYAPLEAIVKVAGPVIAKHGFSYSFKTENGTDRVKASCVVKHVDGHSEESVMETSLCTKTPIMSDPQQIAATVTFNKRYAFMNAFGITTGGEDDESALMPTGNELRGVPTLGTLRKMLADAKLEESAVAAKFKVGTLEELDGRGRQVLERSLLAKLGPDYIPTIEA